METTSVAPDNSRVLTVKLGRETSFVAYSTDKRSNLSIHLARKMYLLKDLCKNRDQCTEIQLCRTGSFAIEISLLYLHISANFVVKGLKPRKTLQFLTDSNSN